MMCRLTELFQYISLFFNVNHALVLQVNKKFKSICQYVYLSTINTVNFTTLVLQVINTNK